MCGAGALHYRSATRPARGFFPPTPSDETQTRGSDGVFIRTSVRSDSRTASLTG
ncbi:hypothetical protein BLAT2472_40176 [Burkholderia latens]